METAKSLENWFRDLKPRIEGEVLIDAGSRALYATDASNYRQVPLGVVIPRSIDDVIVAVKVSCRYDLPILPRGGGTSLAGQCCNAAVVIDFTKHLTRIWDLNLQEKSVWVEPGVVLDSLREIVEPHQLNFGPDPSTHNHCTFGGMIGNNSCGVHSVFAGRTAENVIELDVLTYEGLRLTVGSTSKPSLARLMSEKGPIGTLYKRLATLAEVHGDLIRQRFPDIPRRVSGYNLPALLPENGFHLARALSGSEGTCALILGAKLKLIDWPRARSLVIVGFPDIFAAADAVPEILRFDPIGLEGMDDYLVDCLRKNKLAEDCLHLLPEGKGWLLAEFGGQSEAEADAKGQRMIDAIAKRGLSIQASLLKTEEHEEKIWTIRESALGATARIPGEPDTWEGWEDSAVAPERMGEYLRELSKLYRNYGYRGALYGHFGDGCVHSRINFDFSREQGVRSYRAFIEEAAHLVNRLGGSFSGEHGDGQARAELLPLMFGEDMVQVFREFKAVWDPRGKMNPGKVVDAYRMDENLRLGPSLELPKVRTHFSYFEDGSDFNRAALRCVGVGECRRAKKGTMCPSYMVTREEKHSTRGRARLLFEMLHGQTLKGGWRDEAVKESLDLCLACKGCKDDCPVKVDMATYKSEFFAHYYKGRLRPRQAYAMGLIRNWAVLARRAPAFVNTLSHAPGLSEFIKFAGGIAGEREMPRFAAETFRKWFAKRPPAEGKRQWVLLWPDTFSDHFSPEIPRAAVHALEGLGFAVSIPERELCCGRPLYDFGMLKKAKRLLEGIIDALRVPALAGLPIVGLEPSCVAIFRDELKNFFPNDETANALGRQMKTLSEFVNERAADIPIPHLHAKAIVHGHCHHKAVMGFQEDEKLLERLGLDFTVLDSGCCGMAGSFGFERGHYGISVAIGERVLLPAVRNADPDTWIIADGFSCRQQIEQLTGRRPFHMAEVLVKAILHAEDRSEALEPQVALRYSRERGGRHEEAH